MAWLQWEPRIWIDCDCGKAVGDLMGRRFAEHLAAPHRALEHADTGCGVQQTIHFGSVTRIIKMDGSLIAWGSSWWYAGGVEQTTKLVLSARLNSS